MSFVEISLREWGPATYNVMVFYNPLHAIEPDIFDTTTDTLSVQALQKAFPQGHQTHRDWQECANEFSSMQVLDGGTLICDWLFVK